MGGKVLGRTDPKKKEGPLLLGGKNPEGLDKGRGYMTIGVFHPKLEGGRQVGQGRRSDEGVGIGSGKIDQ